MIFLKGIGYFHHTALLYRLLVNKTFTVGQLENYKVLKKSPDTKSVVDFKDLECKIYYFDKKTALKTN